MNRYRVYGLTIASELEMPELVPSMRAVDVVVQYGVTPEKLSNIVRETAWFQINDLEFLMWVEDVGRYYVSNGNTIHIEPITGAEEKNIRLFLLGSAMAAILHQRNMLPLHGSAITTLLRAFIFLGHPGAGKSTTVAALRLQGYQMLSDDVTVITTDQSGIPIAQPGYPQQKLRVDTVDKLEVRETSIGFVDPYLSKYGVRTTYDFASEATPIHKIYILEPQDVPEFRTETVEGMEKVMWLRAHTYRAYYLDGKHDRDEYFNMLMKVAEQVPMVKIIRPYDADTVASVVDFIEQEQQL